MQYFQFDEYGNMYVYEPGSGFPGEAKLVEPGFEWSELSCSSETSQVVEYTPSKIGIVYNSFVQFLLKIIVC